MTDPTPYPTPAPGTQAPPRRKRRVFMWVFLAIQAVFLIWVITGVSGASGNCDGRAGQSLEACRAGTALGAGIGVMVILFFWAVVDIILGITYLITRRR